MLQNDVRAGAWVNSGWNEDAVAVHQDAADPVSPRVPHSDPRKGPPPWKEISS